MQFEKKLFLGFLNKNTRARYVIEFKKMVQKKLILSSKTSNEIINKKSLL